jgi:hypothetical protein
MAVAMHLYNFSLQKATQITHAVHGNFTGTKQQVRCTCHRVGARCGPGWRSGVCGLSAAAKSK